MKEIICPYSWDCGEQFSPQAMRDYDFLESAIEKGMPFMFLHCPKCSRRFQFNPVEWRAEASYPDPNEKTNKEITSTKKLLETLEKFDVEIPQLYLDYLTSARFRSQISIIKGQEKFHLYSLEELCEQISIDRNSCLRITELTAYAKSLKEIFGEETTEDFSLSELADCLTIGAGNEAILFLDYRDKDSLWIFHPDGGDIEPAKMTLNKIIKRK